MMTAETLPELVKPDANSTSRAALPSARLVTVFEDAGNYNIKHPLQYSWCLWHRPAGGRGGNTDWTQSLKKIQTCGAVEDFWYMMNNVPSIERMDPDNDYHLFREGIMPAWEDPVNAKGGSFVMNCGSTATAASHWTSLVLACIGSQFTRYDCICGISISKRDIRASRLTLWINTTEAGIAKSIESEYMSILNETPSSFLFKRHASSSSQHDPRPSRSSGPGAKYSSRRQ